MDIAGLKLVVIDTETGGPSANDHSILSIALVIWHGEMQPPVFERLICEGDLIVTPEGMANNRIDLPTLGKEGLSPPEAIEQLESFIREHHTRDERATLAGHNVGFDIAFLKRLYRLAGRDYGRTFSHRSFDTVSVLRYLRLTGLLDLPDESSDTAFAHFGIQPASDRRHEAAADVVATANLISQLVALGLVGLPKAQPALDRARLRM